MCPTALRELVATHAKEMEQIGHKRATFNATINVSRSFNDRAHLSENGDQTHAQRARQRRRVESRMLYVVGKKNFRLPETVYGD